MRLYLKNNWMLLFILISNFWIWKILSTNLLLGVVIIISTFSLWNAIKNNNKKHHFVLLVATITLLFFQWRLSFISPFFYQNESDKVNLQERLNAYPPVSIHLGKKTIWVPIANWLEQRRETIIFYKLKSNLSEAVDPNLYFFANHPRERVGQNEFEKYPYIFIFPFILGFFQIQKKHLKSLFLAASPLFIISLIGNSTLLGPFGIFSLVTILVSLGMEKIVKNKKLFLPFLIFFVIVFIQTYAYTKF